MKTLNEIKDEVCSELGYDSYDDINIEYLACREHQLEDMFDLIAKRYAEQALDEAADKAQEMNYDLSNRHPDKMVFRDFQIVYATPKQEILSIKEQLK